MRIPSGYSANRRLSKSSTWSGQARSEITVTLCFIFAVWGHFMLHFCGRSEMRKTENSRLTTDTLVPLVKLRFKQEWRQILHAEGG